MQLKSLQYFGTIAFIKSLINEEFFYFDKEQLFQKMTFTNRMIIATAQGPLHLTIPIVGGRDQKKILKDTKISYSNSWAKQHYKALVSSYQRAPFFEFYQQDLEKIYESKPTFLIDFLFLTHNWVKKQVKGVWIVKDEPIQNEFLKKNELINEIDQYTLPKNYQKYPQPIIYQQVFQDKVGFLPNISSIDLLLCCGGKHAKQLLTC